MAAGFVLWRRRAHGRRHERVFFEDALKQIHEAEYRGQEARLVGIAGGLGVDRDRAVQLLSRMEALGLVRSEGEVIRLTAPGRDAARQVLRAHRLWERYLADETGVAQAAWHAMAERHEHVLSREEAELLSARLGHPRYDPHGDPIPTTALEVPRADAIVALNALPPGQPARVAHVEDEPEAVFERITRAGLHVGTDVLVLATTPDEVTFLVEGRQRSLPPILAANVATELVLPGDRFEAEVDAQPLSTLPPGTCGDVVFVSRACLGLERRRLMDLGVVPGTRIEVLGHGPTGDPTAYRIRGATIAVRRSQAEHIRVRPASEEPPA
jgi:DtxR family Mn-dependent transcriptional regulator